MTTADHAPAPSSSPVLSAALPTMESFTYDNAIVRSFIIATLIWGTVGMLVGVLIALQMAWPTANFNLPWLSNGRLRPLHTNAVIFAFAGNAIFAGVYYSAQRLLKARMFSDALSRIHFWGWQLIIVAAAITLPLGISSGKEYAELEWPIDLAIAVVWLTFGVNLIVTMFKRRERHLYVALWFYISTIIAITMLHVVNSLAMPVTLTKSYSLFAGVQDALVQWWYGHNAVAFFLTTPFLGLMYYFLPKAAERPVYSYRLSIVHFWSLIFLYIWAGPHHLLHASVPEWAQTLGVVFSIMLIAPSWGGMVNGLLTMRGAYHRVPNSPVLKFYVAALGYYGLATFEGCALSLREINAFSHNTDWTIAHVHGGSLGWVGLLIFGMIYWLVPRIYQRALWSDRAANIHFWLCTSGIILYVFSMWTAGIIQGYMQLSFDDAGRLAYANWMDIVRASLPWYWIRIAGGALYLLGMLVCVLNIFMTMRQGRLLANEPAQASPMVKDVDHNALIVEAFQEPAGKKRVISVHGLFERWPGLLIGLTAITLSIGGVCQIIPSLIQGAMTPPIASVRPYSALELTGRDIYIREGCSGCHTQMVRTLRAETERYHGEYTRMGEHIYDRPFLWGSKRTGPDLAREGLIRPSASWHYAHMLDPQLMVKDSVMPPYPWLISDDMDLSTITAKFTALARPPLYTPYDRAAIDGAEQHARRDAEQIAAQLRKDLAGSTIHLPADVEKKEIIALIAYLQRLGTDLKKANKDH
jgi:cytochrome c oxidase cbb3-type subunit I/II